MELQPPDFSCRLTANELLIIGGGGPQNRLKTFLFSSMKSKRTENSEPPFRKRELEIQIRVTARLCGIGTTGVFGLGPGRPHRPCLPKKPRVEKPWISHPGRTSSARPQNPTPRGEGRKVGDRCVFIHVPIRAGFYQRNKRGAFVVGYQKRGYYLAKSAWYSRRVVFRVRICPA